MKHSNSQAATIDRRQLRALLKCYFRLSTRGRITQSMGRSGRSRSVLFALGLYTFTGLMTGFVVLSIHLDVFTYSVLLHSMTFFVVGMAITAESGDILFNVSESDVLVHRPIHPRTLLLAKSVNLIAFALMLAAALNLFPVFFGLAAGHARPWFPLVHVLSITLLCVFCAAGVVCTYGLVIRFLDREKFDNFAAWSQVGLSVLFIFGYQVIPRLLRQLGGVSLQGYGRYLWPLPPAWFAGIDAAAGSDQAGAGMFGLALIGVLITAALSYLAIGRLAPSYAEGLTKLAETRTREPRRTRARTRVTGIRNPILRWWLRDPVELGVFRLTAAYMRRDREIKLRLYPSLAMFVVFPLLGLADRDRGGFSTFVPLITVWMLGSLPATALQAVRMSSQFSAADIFSVAPLASTAPVFHGARKAAIFYLLLPAMCVAGSLIVFLAPAGRESLLLALPGLIAIPTLSLLPGLIEEYLPLSQPAARGEQSSRNMGLMFATMLSMLVVVGFAWLAWSLGLLWLLLLLEILLMALLHWTFNRAIRNRQLTRRE